MKLLVMAMAALALLGTGSTCAQTMEISPNGSRHAAPAPAEYFTGSVIVEPLFGAKDSMPATGGLVTFAPGARSARHTHPAGQILIVTAGTGWVQEEGGEKREIKPGDVIWTPPGVKHWHGATATTSMSHIAITNIVDGRNVDWLEKVSEDQYRK
jgi:quercetin dioxygenase-like cupin family protein